MESPKKLITPLQDWLLTKGKCVSCGRNLILQRKKRLNGHYLVTCACQRNFLFDPQKIFFEKVMKQEVEIYLK